MNSDEIHILNVAFHLLHRNLFSYCSDVGVFNAYNPNDHAIKETCEGLFERMEELADRVVRVIGAAGKTPRLGGFEEAYTEWSFSSYGAMLPRMLTELAAHGRRFKALAKELADSSNKTLIDEAIELHVDGLSLLNGLRNGSCESVEMGEPEVSIKVSEARSRA